MQYRFKGKEYEVLDIYISGYGEKRIAFDEFEDALYKEGRPVSDQASKIDDEIFFYVPNSMQGKSKDEIKQYVESCLYTEPPMNYDEAVAAYGI